MSIETKGPMLWAVAAGPAAFVVFNLWLLTGALTGREPMWPVERYNLAEAALVRDVAAAATLLEGGVPADGEYPIRTAIDDRVPSVRPMEAAVTVGDEDLVQLLLDHGVRLEAQRLERLVCMARSESDEEVERRLMAAHAVSVTCEGA